MNNGCNSSELMKHNRNNLTQNRLGFPKSPVNIDMVICFGGYDVMDDIFGLEKVAVSIQVFDIV